ncbi:hypothetical protein [Flavobacterium limi]|uniref:Fibronectin type-III domain-containing protein n=1 Tax=Flavobacterium limi TaxID=2045105 RepID=A0ABQ1UY32_9FLAO|nr:hypothetical protein [Flavobacterium limi]GGF29987.1 hypothetical protein GCM10011518_44040 [Flavobacterium limi]
MKKITTKLFITTFTVLFYSCLISLNIGCSNNEKDEEKSIIDFGISDISDITENSVVINADFKSNGKQNVLSRGICIAMQTNPTINDMKHEENGNVLGQYNSKFENLQHDTKFYARPYLKTESKIIYGNEHTFTTKKINIPTLTTIAVSEITQLSAVFNGKIENDGASKILSKGFFYSKTNPMPEVKDQKIENTGNSEFSNLVSGLEQNTKYFVRTFASNLAGTAYGQVVSFTTSAYILPTVKTLPISTISETTGIGGGTVVSEGSNPVVERGICWNTAPNPTINYGKSKDGTGMGSFVSNLRSLQPFQLYYIRAYAISQAGIAYGETVTAKTTGGNKPTVTVSARTGNTTLYSTVSVTNQGSTNVTAISIGCFDMDGNPAGKVSSSSSWTIGSTLPSVNYEITGLSRANKYYVIGYATNDVGKSASEKVYFSTL